MASSSTCDHLYEEFIIIIVSVIVVGQLPCGYGVLHFDLFRLAKEGMDAIR